VKDLFDSAEQSARHAPDPDAVCLKHDPEKWEPVFGKDYAQTKEKRLERDDDSKKNHPALASCLLCVFGRRDKRKTRSSLHRRARGK
jgi:hypothetical protein